MLKSSTPKLMVKRQSSLLQEEEEDFQMPSVYANLDSGVNVSQLHSFGPSQQEVSFIPTWDVQSNYSLKIIQATHVNVTENHKVRISVSTIILGTCPCVHASSTYPRFYAPYRCMSSVGYTMVLSPCVIVRPLGHEESTRVFATGTKTWSLT